MGGGGGSCRPENKEGGGGYAALLELYGNYFLGFHRGGGQLPPASYGPVYISPVVLFLALLFATFDPLHLC